MKKSELKNIILEVILEEKKICEKEYRIKGLTSIYRTRKCKNKASLFVDGKWYCKKHDPRKAEKEKKYDLYKDMGYYMKLAKKIKDPKKREEFLKTIQQKK